MKILDAGKWKVYDCKLCRAKLEAEPADVKYVPRDGDGDAYGWLECPVCGSREYLDYSEIPPIAMKGK